MSHGNKRPYCDLACTVPARIGQLVGQKNDRNSPGSDHQATDNTVICCETSKNQS